MKFRQILLTSVAAGALAVTVGACTHSGDDGIPQSQLDAETAAKEAAEKKAAEEQAAKEKAEAEAKAEKERADAAQKELDMQAAEKDGKTARAAYRGLHRYFMNDGNNGEDTMQADTAPMSGFGVDDQLLSTMALKEMDGFLKGTRMVGGEQREITALVLTTKGADTEGQLFAEMYPEDERHSNDGGDLFGAEAAPNIMSDNFPGVAANYDDDETVMGTFHGIDGTYECDSDGGCTVTKAEAGYTLSPGWKFEPDSDTDRIMIPDAVYQQFGWWAEVDDSPDPEVADAHVMHNVMGAGATVVGEAMIGTAKYVGDAIGVYAIHAVLPAAAESGHFSATATLTADFGDGSGMGSISGKIDGFSTSGGSDLGTVILAKNSADNTGFDSAGNFTGETSWEFGGDAGSGNYAGQLFDNEEVGSTRSDPKEVGGTFDASIDSARMIGSFAATLSDD